MTGQIVKALSGFYYVDTGAGEPVPCRGRGKLRHQKATPLVGDRVEVTSLDDELVRRPRRRHDSALVKGELAATLSVVGVMLAMMIRVLVF